MSVIHNGKLIIDRTKIKPRSYADQLDTSRQLKSEILYHFKYKIQVANEAVLDEKRRKAEMEIQKMRGFSGDRKQKRMNEWRS